MTAWAAKLAVLLVFAVGFVCGGAAVNFYRLRIERRIAASPEPVIELVVAGLDRELKLTAEQTEQVRQIMQQSRQEFLAAQLAVVRAERDAYVAAHRLLQAIGGLDPDALGFESDYDD